MRTVSCLAVWVGIRTQQLGHGVRQMSLPNPLVQG
jgi:hypothetical protein